MGTTITTAKDGQLDGNRRLPTPQEFAELVTVACQELVNEGEPFTAYAVTKKLQSEQSALEIRHFPYANIIGVQAAVHDHVMPALMADPTVPNITKDWQDWQGDGARTYTPHKITVTVIDDDDKGVPIVTQPAMTLFDWKAYNSANNQIAQAKGIKNLPIPMLGDGDDSDEDDDDTDD